MERPNSLVQFVNINTTNSKSLIQHLEKLVCTAPINYTKNAKFQTDPTHPASQPGGRVKSSEKATGFGQKLAVRGSDERRKYFRICAQR
jgi:hypothetical protein